MTTREKMLNIAEQLRTNNPALADRITVDRHGCAVGLTSPDGGPVAMLYSSAIGTDAVIDCGYGDGRYPSVAVADW